MFVKNKDNPPLQRYHPPVAGAIYWERFLMDRITSPIERFMEMKEMMESEEGKAVSLQSSLVFINCVVELTYLSILQILKMNHDMKFFSHG